jgi:CheY-like chemotaxis protein
VSLILLDLMMPQTDGGTLYNWLRAHPKTAQSPIIILSALGSVEKRVELLNKGADDYIVKPCPVEELLARVAINIKLGELRRSQQRTEAEISHQQRYWQEVLGVAQGVTVGLSLPELLTEIVETTAVHLQTSRSLLYLKDSPSGEIALAAQFPSEQLLPSAYIPFLKQMLLHQQIHASQKMVGVPLKQGEQLVGLLVLEFTAVPLDVRSLRSALEMLGLLLATAVVNAQLRHQPAPLLALPAPETTAPPHQLAPTTYNQLQDIHGYVQLLQQFSLSPEEQRNYFDLIAHTLQELLDSGV